MRAPRMTIPASVSLTIFAAIRVSIDHYRREVHERERGRRSWPPTIDGFKWLAENGFSLNVASRYLSGEPEIELRRGFARLFAELGVSLNADDQWR